MFKMEYLKYRSRIRIVGIIDTTFMGIGLFVLFVSFIVLYTMSWGVSFSEILLRKLSESSEKDGKSSAKNSTSEAFTISGDVSLTYFYVSTAIDCCVTAVQLAAAILLIYSTKLETHSRTVYRMAGFWFVLGLLVLIVYGIWRIVDQLWLNLVVGMVYRGLVLAFGWKYVCELRRHVVGASPPGWKPPKSTSVGKSLDVS